MIPQPSQIQSQTKYMKYCDGDFICSEYVSIYFLSKPLYMMPADTYTCEIHFSDFYIEFVLVE